MSLKKHLVQLLVVVFGLLILGLNVSAESAYNSKDIRLTENEYDYLINEVGHTKEEIESLPEDVLKQLIKDKAKLVSRESTKDDIATSYSDGEIKLMKTIPKSQLDVVGYGYKTTSDRSGHDKFYLIGHFKWLTLPAFTLVDKMTIGFPESAGLSIPMSSGKPTQHQSRHCWDYWGDGRLSCGAYKKTTSDWSASAGVAASYDIKTYSNWTINSGMVSQYLYRNKSLPSKTINVKFEYGHKRISGSPSVTVYPAGLGITPTATTDTQAYGIELDL